MEVSKRKILIENLKKMKDYASDEKIIFMYEKYILELNNPEISYYFALHFKGADIQKHGEIVINSNNLNYNYLYAKDIKGADVKAHGQVIIDSKVLDYNYFFARNVEGADVKAHGEVIIDSKISKYSYLFARDVKGADIPAHADIVLKYGTLEENFYFAIGLFKGVYAAAHKDKIFESNNLEYINKLKKYEKNIKINQEEKKLKERIEIMNNINNVLALELNL